MYLIYGRTIYAEFFYFYEEYIYIYIFLLTFEHNIKVYEPNNRSLYFSIKTQIKAALDKPLRDI